MLKTAKGDADYIGLRPEYQDYGYRSWLRDMGLYQTIELMISNDATMFHWDGLNYATYIGKRDGNR